MDFANIITKKISILIAGHVITDEGPVGHNEPLIWTFVSLGEHGQPERGNAEVVEGPQHQGLLLMHTGAPKNRNLSSEN